MARALREPLAGKRIGGRDGFRWRGGEISAVLLYVYPLNARRPRRRLQAAAA